MLKTIVVECAVKEVRVDIGSGNRLVLFKGDKINVSTGTTVRHQYRVVDSSGKVIGHITKRAIRCITDQPIRKGKQNALVT